jgi:hypothetical protein
MRFVLLNNSKFGGFSHIHVLVLTAFRPLCDPISLEWVLDEGGTITTDVVRFRDIIDALAMHVTSCF